VSRPVPKSAEGRDHLAVVLCVALATLVMLPGLGRASLWWDECHSVRMAQTVLERPPAEVLDALAHGMSPYFALLAPIARDRVGEAWLRFPSVLAALGLVVVAAGIGRDLGGRALAWRVGLATAVSPFIVWHAREVRWYTLAWLLAALSLRAGLRAARGAGGRSLAVSAVWGLMAASVFSPAIVLLPPIVIASIGALRAAHGGAHVVDPASRRRRFVIAGGVASIVLVAGFWLWRVLLGPALRGGAAGLGFANLGDLSPAAVGYTAVAMATGYTIGPGPIEWHHQPPVMPSPLEAALLLGGVLLLAGLVLRGAGIVRRTTGGRAAALLVVQSVLPVAALAAAADWTGHRYAPRHAGLIALPVLVLAAAGTLSSGSRRRWPAVAGGMLLVLQALSLVNLHTSARYLREQVRDAADYVDRAASPDDLVLVFGGVDLPWRYYDHGRIPSRVVYADDPSTWTPETMPEILAGHDRVVVVRGTALYDAREAPLLAAVAAVSRMETSARFPGLEVEVRGLTAARP
jgi:hypothetical protein